MVCSLVLNCKHKRKSHTKIKTYILHKIHTNKIKVTESKN